jgi:hypothetical protein
MRLGVDRVRPAGPQGQLHPVLAASGTADQLNTVQYCGWSQLFPEGELQLSEVGKNFAHEIRITGVCDVIVRIATRTQDVSGDGRNKEKLIIAEL